MLLWCVLTEDMTKYMLGRFNLIEIPDDLIIMFPFKGTSSCVVKRDGNALRDCVVKRLYNQSNEHP